MLSRELKEKWIDALRRGKYRHGKSRLKDLLASAVCGGEPCYSCLGVLAELAGVEFHSQQDYRTLDDVDLPGLLGPFRENSLQWQLLDLNDGVPENGSKPKPFAEIADWIEANVPCNTQFNVVRLPLGSQRLEAASKLCAPSSQDVDAVTAGIERVRLGLPGKFLAIIWMTRVNAEGYWDAIASFTSFGEAAESQQFAFQALQLLLAAGAVPETTAKAHGPRLGLDVPELARASVCIAHPSGLSTTFVSAISLGPYFDEIIGATLMDQFGGAREKDALKKFFLLCGNNVLPSDWQTEEQSREVKGTLGWVLAQLQPLTGFDIGQPDSGFEERIPGGRDRDSDESQEAQKRDPVDEILAERPMPVETENTYPYLMLRLAPAFHLRGPIQITTGPAGVEVLGIGPPASRELNPMCLVRHPEPYATDGTVSQNCRGLVIQRIQDICRQTPRFRMCIVWTESFCTYVDADSTDENSPPPSGGAPTGDMQISDRVFDAQSLSNVCLPSVAPSSSHGTIETSRATTTHLRREVLTPNQIAELLEHLRTLGKAEQQFDHEVRHNRIIADTELLPTLRKKFSELSTEDQERLERVERVHVQEIEIHKLVSRELSLKDPPAGQYVSHWQEPKSQDPPQPEGINAAPTRLPPQDSAAADQESSIGRLRRGAQDGSGRKPVRWTLWDRCRAWYYRQFHWTAEQRAAYAYANAIAHESHPTLRGIENRIRAIQEEAPAPDGSFEAWDRSERISILTNKYEATLQELISHDK